MSEKSPGFPQEIPRSVYSDPQVGHATLQRVDDPNTTVVVQEAIARLGAAQDWLAHVSRGECDLGIGLDTAALLIEQAAEWLHMAEAA